jgi:hypothetical protein
MTRHVHYAPPEPLPLFDREQSENLIRVSGAISKAIIGFLRARLNNGTPEFFADELRQWVSCSLSVAPGSADRILRDLRKAGRVSYRVINRPKSLYRVESVA